LSDLPDPIPAATLILMRPSRDGSPELLVIERAANMAFAAGALVFPGGRIDADDHLIAQRHAEADAAAKVAAIRETIEETGIAIGLKPEPNNEMARTLREGLASGTPFPALLDSCKLELDLGALTPFARWCPNFRETRRFDTLFFVAEAPADAAGSADTGEAVRILWASAAAILERTDSGRDHVIFPTRRNLERLAQFASIEEARADAARNPVRKVTPWVEERGGRKWVCIPEDIGYPVTAELLETARRS
jgi:8-oxo-dGTP pyrophosphatase MutT (NUDIX family)